MPHYPHTFATQTIRRSFWTALVVFAVACGSMLDAAEPSKATKNTETPKVTKKSACKKTPDKKKSTKKKDPFAWKSLFDGKTLKGWKSGKFGGEGEVHVKDGAIIMDCGESLTGVIFTGKPPRMNYEISLEAKRLDGSDFFATTTFPIGKSYCSLVVGGWGGTVVGLSCVDFYDAGDNITTRFVDLKTKQWYKIRIRVSQARIEAWIGTERIVDLLTKDHKFDTRFEVDLCKPLGIASWCTTGAIRNIRIRALKPKEIAAAAKKREDD